MKIMSFLWISFLITFDVYAQSTYPFGPGGAPTWQFTVPSVAALPAAGNVIGDVRIETTTFGLYVWDGAAWILDSGGGGGSGTVTDFSFVPSNGFVGNVATSTTTPALTISVTPTLSGILKASAGSLASAVAGTDYQSPLFAFTAPSNEFVYGFNPTNSFLTKQPNFYQITGTVTSDKMMPLPQNDIYVGNSLNYPVSVAANGFITSQTLVGFVSSTGIVTAADSILSAFDKLVGNLGSLTFNNILGTVSPTQNGIGPVTKSLYVDINRVDIYVADGTISRPFKTIMGAVNKVIANADGVPYEIIITPGLYTETITLNNANLVNLSFRGSGHGSTQAILSGPSVGDVIRSDANNSNLIALSFQGIKFQGAITLQGAVNNTNLCAIGCVFLDNDILGDSALTLNNVNNVYFFNTSNTYDIPTNITNAAFVQIDGGASGWHGNLSLVTNGALPAPPGFDPVTQASGTRVVLDNVVAVGDTTVDFGSYIQLRKGARLGSPGGSVSVTGGLECYNSFFRADINIIAGAFFRNHDCSWNSTLTNAGTITNDGLLGYTPAVSGNWSPAPAYISTALDQLAARPSGGGGSGTVTSVSISNTNGFTGSVSNPTTTANITISTTVTGMLKGLNSAITTAISGVDYQAPIPGFSAPPGSFFSTFTPTGTFGTSLVITQALTGFISGTGIVTAADSILTAFDKIVANIGSLNFANILGTATVAQTTVSTQTIAATNIDWSLGSLFVQTLGASTTFTFSNQRSGQTIVVRLTNTASNYTVTWPTVKWAGGAAPTMTTGATSDVYTFVFDGTDIFGSYVQDMH